MPSTNEHNRIDLISKIILFINEGERLFTTILKTTAQLIIKVFQFFTPAIAPAPTAGLFGVNIFLAMENQVSIMWIRQGIAITLALSLEGAGFLALKSAVRFYYLWRQERKNTEYLYVAMVISALYIAIGIGSTVLLENVSNDLRLLGITAFLIAPLVYAASSLWDELDLAIAETKLTLEKAEAQAEQTVQETLAAEHHQQEIEAEERAFRHQVELEQLHHVQALELQQLAANDELARLKMQLEAQVKTTTAYHHQEVTNDSQPTTSNNGATLSCEGCHKPFANYRALNGHKRSCAAWHQYKQHKQSVIAISKQS